jgi:putative transposase
MTAQSSQKLGKSKTFIHVSKIGVNKRKLFIDKQDYDVFLGYLKDYLSAPPDTDKIKKSFTVNGRTFHGVPHQPNNYFKKVELVAYNLMPDHFHLLVYQINKGSLEKLMRSLCTRYAIYYNKKYKRRGSLFQGSHKSIQIKSVSELVHLTRYIHLESLKEKADVNYLNRNGYSSYKEYLGERVTSWIKPNVILSYFDKSKNSYFKGINGYKNFVEKYKLNQEDKKLLKNITFESKPKRNEKSILTPAPPEKGEHPKKVHVRTAPVSKSVPKSRLNIFGFISTATVVFILLFSVGIRNVFTSTVKTTESVASLPSPTPQVAGEKDTTKGEVKTETKQVVIKITDGSSGVNIREKPTTKSAKVGKANDGDIFELISQESNWYQIKLDDGSTAFVSAGYAQIEQIEGDENN